MRLRENRRPEKTKRAATGQHATDSQLLGLAALLVFSLGTISLKPDPRWLRKESARLLRAYRRASLRAQELAAYKDPERDRCH